MENEVKNKNSIRVLKSDNEDQTITIANMENRLKQFKAKEE